jgi:hypothetical protein
MNQGLGAVDGVRGQWADSPGTDASDGGHEQFAHRGMARCSESFAARSPPPTDASMTMRNFLLLAIWLLASTQSHADED